ncbi:MAG TPA: TPM domain-containing protein, partial [Nitrospiraceae bacterium]|nr:TPM domain-containing protein [Nitrospiraceae bacterium]
GRIVDRAAVLPPQAAANLTALLKAHEETTGNQVAVLILPSLEGAPLEPYAHRVITTWKLGQKGADNGALLLVAIKDRKVRIEVGYGLEGTLTDIRSAQIIRNEIVPRFQAGDLPGGITVGVEAILKTIEGTYRATDHPRRPAESGELSATFQYVALGTLVGTLAGLILSQGRRQTRAFFGSLLAFLIAQSASLLAGLGAAVVTLLLIALILSGAGIGGGGRRRLRRDSDLFWFPGGIESGWPGGASGGFGGGFGGGDSFSGGGGDAGGGGASGSW